MTLLKAIAGANTLRPNAIDDSIKASRLASTHYIIKLNSLSYSFTNNTDIETVSNNTKIKLFKY